MTATNDQVKDLVNTLWFVVQDLNSDLDYETRMLLLDKISRHSGISTDDLVKINSLDIASIF
jgi:hypothetical protein